MTSKEQIILNLIIFCIYKSTIKTCLKIVHILFTRLWLIIKDDPVGGILPLDGEEFLNRPVVFPIPRVVPPCSHVTIQGVFHPETFQSVQKKAERQRSDTVDDAEFSVQLAECPEAFFSVRFEAALETISVTTNCPDSSNWDKLNTSICQPPYYRRALQIYILFLFDCSLCGKNSSLIFNHKGKLRTFYS